VAGGHIRLVDYDGMFVPGLRGNAPDERGNDQFQHPTRSKQDHDEGVDRFAALVIYLSLRALAVDPHLWEEFHTGENLILSRDDFLCYCPECLAQGKRTALHGWQKAPCGHMAMSPSSR